MAELKDPLPCSTETLREVMAKFVTGEARELPGRDEIQTAILLLQAAYCRLAQAPRDMPFVEVVAESDRVMKVFAAPEWDCLNEDGHAWAAAIAEEARAIERGAVIDMLSIEHNKWMKAREGYETKAERDDAMSRAMQLRAMANYVGNGGHWK